MVVGPALKHISNPSIGRVQFSWAAWKHMDESTVMEAWSALTCLSSSAQRLETVSSQRKCL